MHKYLRAIGFSKIASRKQLESIYQQTLSNPNRKVATTIGVDTTLIQFFKDFGNGIGLSLVGEIDASGSLSIEHYFPYVIPQYAMEMDEIKVEKHCDKDSYAGVCDELNMSLIFFVQNIADYTKLNWFSRKKVINCVMLSGLSSEGVILLPLAKTIQDLIYEKKSTQERSELMRAAKSGDTDALETLALEDIDMANSVARRTYTEDVLSIVDTSLIPYGVECEHYAILGTIRSVKIIKNTVTNELLYNMVIECNNLIINICINTKDLQGEPAPGRRFRGIVWLQGHLVI